MSSAFTGQGSEPASGNGPDGVAGNPDGSICRVEALDPSKGVPDEALDREYPLVPPYSRYADLYDHLDQTAFGLAVVSLIEQLAQARRPPCGECSTWPAGRALSRSGSQRADTMSQEWTAPRRC